MYDAAFGQDNTNERALVTTSALVSDVTATKRICPGNEPQQKIGVRVDIKSWNKHQPFRTEVDLHSKIRHA